MSITFRDANDADYRRFREIATDAYVEQMVGFGGYDEEEARAKAARDMATLLPEEGPAPGHRLTLAFDGEEQVGSLWTGPRMGDGAGPWIFDVRVDPSRRGQGIGRVLMEHAERQARELGATKLGLNVFGANAVAIALYDSLGFRVDSQQMSKVLD